MYDFIRVVLAAEHLIRALSRCFANACRMIKDAFPGWITGDFVNDENVRHEVVDWSEGASRQGLILVEMLSLHQIDVLNA